MQREPDFESADDPADGAQQKARRDLGALAIHRMHACVDGIRPIEQRRPVPARAKLGDATRQPAEQATALREIKAVTHRAEQRCDRSACDPEHIGVVRYRVHAENEQAHDREQHLSDRLHRRADRDDRRRFDRRGTELRQTPDHQHRAADLAGRQ